MYNKRLITIQSNNYIGGNSSDNDVAGVCVPECVCVYVCQVKCGHRSLPMPLAMRLGCFRMRHCLCVALTLFPCVSLAVIHSSFHSTFVCLCQSTYTHRLNFKQHGMDFVYVCSFFLLTVCVKPLMRLVLNWTHVYVLHAGRRTNIQT